MIINYPTVTGSTGPWVNALPWALPAAATAGVLATRKGNRAAAPADPAVPAR
jgi:hypothetical protein